MACSVAMLIIGKETWQFKEFQKLQESQPHLFFEIVDVRDWIRDPMASLVWKVKHFENSEVANTMANLLHDSGFVKAVSHVSDFIWTEYCKEVDMSPNKTCVTIGKVLPIMCKAGVHRSDGVAKMSAGRVLNTAIVDDKRVFNANTFTLFNTEHPHEVMKYAVHWINDPWCTIEAVIAHPPPLPARMHDDEDDDDEDDADDDEHYQNDEDVDDAGDGDDADAEDDDDDDDDDGDDEGCDGYDGDEDNGDV